DLVLSQWHPQFDDVPVFETLATAGSRGMLSVENDVFVKWRLISIPYRFLRSQPPPNLLLDGNTQSVKSLPPSMVQCPLIDCSSPIILSPRFQLQLFNGVGNV